MDSRDSKPRPDIGKSVRATTLNYPDSAHVRIDSCLLTKTACPAEARREYGRGHPLQSQERRAR